MRKWLMVLAAAVVVSCTSIDCPVNSLVLTHYQFTSSDGQVLTLLDTLTVAMTRKDGSDTLFNKGTQLSTFYLPISIISFIFCAISETSVGLHAYPTLPSLKYPSIP